MAKAELGGVEVKKKRYLVMTVAAVLIMAAVAIFIQSSGSFGVCAPEKPGNPRGQSVKEVV